MRVFKKKALCGLLCVFAVGSSFAQEAQTDSPLTEIFAPVLVQGLGNPATASYVKLLRGVKAFVANQALAPLAPVRFQIVDLSKSEVPTKLRLEAGDKIIPIALDAEGLFELPTVDVVGSADGELVTNRKAGKVKVAAFVASPGTSRESQRLGDVRLWCEVTWAMWEYDEPIFGKLVSLMTDGPCKSTKIKIGRLPPPGWKATFAEILEGSRREAIAIRDKEGAFSPPITDLSWSNEAVLQVKYVPVEAPKQ